MNTAYVKGSFPPPKIALNLFWSKHFTFACSYKRLPVEVVVVATMVATMVVVVGVARVVVGVATGVAVAEAGLGGMLGGSSHDK